MGQPDPRPAAPRPSRGRPPLARRAAAAGLLLALVSPGRLSAGEETPPPPALPATVLSIGDGDTLRVTQAGRPITVRMACIDAPEMVQTPWGARSRAFLSARLPVGSSVTLRVQTLDRYGRSVAEVIGATNLNLEMVENGQAFAYRQYLRGCDRKAYLDAEVRARLSGLGVWYKPDGITRPWDFRRSRRATHSSDGDGAKGLHLRCSEIGSYSRAQDLLRQGHTYLDADGNGKACESLR